MSEAQMTKDQWVELFEAIGLDKPTMQKWHREFERRYPAQHQSFLEWIGLSAVDITRVRSYSQTA